MKNHKIVKNRLFLQQKFGSAIVEFAMIAPLLCLFFTLVVFFNDIVNQKLFVEVSTRNLAGMEKGSNDEGPISDDSKKRAIERSGVRLSPSAQFNANFIPNIEANSNNYKFNVLVKRMNRRESSWKDERNRFLEHLKIPESTPYDYIGSTESYLTQWYTSILLDQTSYILIDDTASALKVQVDYSQPLEVYQFGENVKLLLDMISTAAKKNNSEGASETENEGVFPQNLAFSNLVYSETQGGYHPEEYQMGGLIGFALYGMIAQNPPWFMKASDYKYSKERLKQGFSRACPFEFRANSKCTYNSIFQSTIYAQIIVYVAETASVADIITAFFSDGGSTAAKKAAWEAVEKGVKEAGKAMINQFEQMAKEKVKQQVDEIANNIKEKVNKEMKEKFNEITEKIKNEYFTKEKFLEWLGMGGGESS